MSTTVKKALRGLADLSIFPVTANTATQYTTGTQVKISGVQEFTATKDAESWKIFADDGIFEVGSVWKGNNFTLTLAGLPLELRSYFEGGSYDEETEEYTFLAASSAPEIALSFSSLAGSGKKELTKIYAAKCTKVSFDHKTSGNGQGITPVKIEGSFISRKLDNAVFTKKDADEANISWLDSIDL